MRKPTFHVTMTSTIIVSVEADTPAEAKRLALEHTPSYVFGANNVTVSDVAAVPAIAHHVWIREEEKAS